MDPSLIWAFGLVILGLVFLASEAFIPSAGILGVLSASSLLGGILMAFYVGGLRTGTAFMGGTMVSVAVTMAAMVKWWPQTKLGKLILNHPRPADEVVPDRSSLQCLIGLHGKSLALMVPGGLIEIDARTYDAAAISGSIEKGEWVEVVAVKGRNLVVKAVGNEIARQLEQGSAERSTMLESVDEVVPDPFADPLS